MFAFGKKSGTYSWKASFLGCQLHSIGLHVYLYSNTLLLILELCNIIWSQGLWYVHHCFLIRIGFMFRVFCVSI
jgi:hypothetical protein